MRLKGSIPCVRLGDHCEVKRGISWERACESPTGTPALTIPNIQDRLDLSKLTHLSGVPTAHIKKATVRGGHTIMVGSNGNKNRVGDCLYFPHDTDYVFASFLMGIRPHPDSKLDSRYTYYWLKSPAFRRPIQASLIGATSLGNLRINTLRDVMVPAPSLPIQQRIAEILATYDDLIENGLHRIGTLEQMARALYREWFVNFRFPNHGSIPRARTSLGDIPESWQVKRLPECIHINPRVVVQSEGEKPFVPMGCLSNDSMIISDIESREGNSGAKFQNSDTLFARITPCLENGKTGFVQFLPDADAVAFGSTEFIVLRSRTLTPEFVYCLARSDSFRGIAIKSMSGATGRQRVQERCFHDFQIAHPPRKLLTDFSAIVSPMFQLIHKLHMQTQNLRQTRDLLLPRLVAGEISL